MADRCGPGGADGAGASGSFAVIRNPIFTFVIAAQAGAALLVPSVIALLGVAMLVAAVEIQVRLVEEPHLRRAHGAAYAAYARRVGRFLPRVGRLRMPPGA